MKKIVMGTCAWIAMLGIVSLLNNIVMLSIHDLDYYYTIEGLKMSGLIAVAEALILVPASRIMFKLIMGKEEFYRVFGEKEESR